MRVYLIRHGQTRWNTELRWQGQTDIELTETGLMQACATAERLKGCGITTLYSSPLKRARATAEVIGRELSLRPFFRDGLREISLGAWEGLTLSDIRATDAERLRIWEDEPEREPGMGIESYAALSLRAAAETRDICRLHGPDDTIALVTHGAWMRAFMLLIMNIPLNRRLCFDLFNCGISILSYNHERDSFKITTLNDFSHT